MGSKQGALYTDPAAVYELSRALVESIPGIPLIIKVGLTAVFGAESASCKGLEGKDKGCFHVWPAMAIPAAAVEAPELSCGLKSLCTYTCLNPNSDPKP